LNVHERNVQIKCAVQMHRQRFACVHMLRVLKFANEAFRARGDSYAPSTRARVWCRRARTVLILWIMSEELRGHLQRRVNLVRCPVEEEWGACVVLFYVLFHNLNRSRCILVPVGRHDALFAVAVVF
jgi:hypothetical protein